MRNQIIELLSKKILTVPLVLYYSTYLILFCYERITTLHQIININLLESFEKQIQFDLEKNFITDLMFIEKAQECDGLYEQILPYPTCDLHQQIKEYSAYTHKYCYDSERDVDNLVLYENNESQSRLAGVKICGKIINSSNFRSQQILFKIDRFFQKTCFYKDTEKRGYITSGNICYLNSYDQKCQQNEMKLENQFMVYCLDVNDRKHQEQLNSFSCSENEIACSSFQTFYCIKNTKECPIIDVQVTTVFLPQGGYENVNIELQGFYINMKRNDLLNERLIGLEIKDYSKNLNDRVIQNIKVWQEGDLQQTDESNLLFKDKVVEKIKQKFQMKAQKLFRIEGLQQVKNIISVIRIIIYFLRLITVAVPFVLFFNMIKYKQKAFYSQIHKSMCIELGGFLLNLPQAVIMTAGFYHRYFYYSEVIDTIDQNIVNEVFSSYFTDYILIIQPIFTLCYLQKQIIRLKQ